MKRMFTLVHNYLAYVVLAAVVFQFFLAGVGVFGAGSIEYHIINGGVIALGTLLLALVSLLARPGRKIVGGSFLLFALAMLQGLLVEARPISPFITALHPVNALAVLYYAYALSFGRLRAALPLPAAAQPAAPAGLGNATRA